MVRQITLCHVLKTIVLTRHLSCDFLFLFCGRKWSNIVKYIHCNGEPHSFLNIRSAVCTMSSIIRCTPFRHFQASEVRLSET